MNASAVDQVWQLLDERVQTSQASIREHQKRIAELERELEAVKVLIDLVEQSGLRKHLKRKLRNSDVVLAVLQRSESPLMLSEIVAAIHATPGPHSSKESLNTVLWRLVQSNKAIRLEDGAYTSI